MSNLTPKLREAFAEGYNRIRSGELKTLIPYLCLFRLNGKPMNLKMHYQLAPMYATVQPSHSLYMLARQLGKSYASCSSMGLRNMLIPFYHTVLIQPRADQIQRLISTVYKPLLNSCPVIDEFITSTERTKLALREFRSGSMCYAEHMFESADRLRGISGAASVSVDESLFNEQFINLFDSSSKQVRKVMIKDVKAGDITISFSEGLGHFLLSPVVRDASYHGRRKCFRVTTDGGWSIECTADHLLPTSWGKLRVADIILSEYSNLPVEPWDSPIVRARLTDNVDAYEAELIDALETHSKPAGHICLLCAGFGDLNFQDNVSPTTMIWENIKSIEYIGTHDVYDIEVVGTHNYIVGDGICSYNCQDIEYEFLDIAAEVMSASLFWGFSIYTGTPKTTDTTLGLLWERSSQAEWITKCLHCGKYNVPNPENDLVKMIGKHGPICAHCGKDIYPHDGGWIHAVPARMNAFPGYHLSQSIHPLHMVNQHKWNQLLAKVNTYSEQALYNEVFGWPYDAATSPLTMTDMQKATFTPTDEYGNEIDVQSPDDVLRVSWQYRFITIGVDWSGGGMISDSFTAYAVLGLRKDSDVIDVIYGKRIPKGATPTEEADEILYWLKGCHADAFAYDNHGAGFTRLEIMKHQGLHNLPKQLFITPMDYVRPHSGDVMQKRDAIREPDMYYFNIDKSRSLAICILSIKSNRIRFRPFKPEDEQAYQRDFLALREDPRKSLGNETVMLIIKKPGVPDDFAHAVNFGCSQIWDHFGAYPAIGSRYDASILDFDENHNRILPDDQFGPRSDWDRFTEAVNLRASIVESDMPY